MENSLLYILMLVGGLIMSVLPFLIFMGLGTLFGIDSVNFTLLVSLFIVCIIASFLVSFTSFVVVQKNQCGKVQNFGNIAKFAGISTAIHTGALLLATFIPFLRNSVLNLMPPDTDPRVVGSTVYGYYSFWGILFGLALGGNMTSICA
jgi:hypothetical protein